MRSMQKRKPAKGRTLYIKNPAAHRLAEQVSKRLGVTLSDAVIQALQEQVRKTGKPINRKRVDALCERFDALPVLDDRTADEILGYNDFGLSQ